MSAADKRVAELLDRWLASVELHARYLELDAAGYAKVQAWPKHERPTRWVIDLARTRLNELKRLHAERIAQGDAAFAEALELMGFLANLVGSEHVERFIPLAVQSPPPAKPPAEARPEAAAVDPTIEQTAPHRTRPATASARSAERTRAAPRATRKPATAPPAKASASPASLDKVAALVIADAVRMLNWGREWPQIAGLIARLADRPSEPDVWKILRSHRATIEAQAKRPLD
ncbi:MAG TPA: hypothetical protein VLH36_07470 [Steroidobacteraceae bacterium]|jgi:hypothetical protein|nr:hypothetical protein [Steroidobacteraceae bacterium]